MKSIINNYIAFLKMKRYLFIPKSRNLKHMTIPIQVQHLYKYYHNEIYNHCWRWERGVDSRLEIMNNLQLLMMMDVSVMMPLSIIC